MWFHSCEGRYAICIYIYIYTYVYVFMLSLLVLSMPPWLQIHIESETVFENEKRQSHVVKEGADMSYSSYDFIWVSYAVLTWSLLVFDFLHDFECGFYMMLNGGTYMTTSVASI